MNLLFTLGGCFVVKEGGREGGCMYLHLPGTVKCLIVSYYYMVRLSVTITW